MDSKKLTAMAAIRLPCRASPKQLVPRLGRGRDSAERTRGPQRVWSTLQAAAVGASRDEKAPVACSMRTASVL